MAKSQLRDRYRAHPRVPYSGLLQNHMTGELYEPPRRVKQSHVAECDINNILKQYSQTGQIAHINSRAKQGSYMDLPDESDFQTSMQIVKQGEAAFATLPSKVRDRFNNDPGQFLQFMADAGNVEEAIKLGLVTKRTLSGTPLPDPPEKVTPAPAGPPQETQSGADTSKK